jgi:hypothetical protein
MVTLGARKWVIMYSTTDCWDNFLVLHIYEDTWTLKHEQIVKPVMSSEDGVMLGKSTN